MLPGRRVFGPEDLLRILWSRKWLIPGFVGLIARVLNVPVLAAIPVLALEDRRADTRGSRLPFLPWRGAA